MQNFKPSPNLTPFIKEYLVVNFEEEIRNEIFYPSGYIDFVINVSDGRITTAINERRVDMPRLEILGQLTVPTRLYATTGTSIMIARIYPYASSLFFPSPISEFKNESVDFSAIMSSAAARLSNAIEHAGSIDRQINVLDAFFTERLTGNQGQIQKVKMIAQMCDLLNREVMFDIQQLASKFRLSDRYIQKMFEFTVGLSPRSFFNINRFKKSLHLVQLTDQQLTSIAYSCGYFDQAHLIREFKQFTGITPSEARRAANGKALKDTAAH